MKALREEMSQRVPLVLYQWRALVAVAAAAVMAKL